MVALKSWLLHKYVVMFLRLFPMLDVGSNRAHVGLNHRYLIIFTNENTL